MTTVPLSEAKTHLAKLLADVEALGEEVIITRSGRPVGVLLSLTDYEGLIETLEILADQDLHPADRRWPRSAPPAPGAHRPTGSRRRGARSHATAGTPSGACG